MDFKINKISLKSIVLLRKHFEISEDKTDDEVIELHPDEWAWYMQGFTDAKKEFYNIYKKRNNGY